MVAYAKGFNGDVVIQNAIVDTVEEKSTLIPGIITNPELSVSLMGEVAAFYTASKSSVAEGQVGGKVDYEVSGGIRHDVNLTKALHIGKIFPRAMYATVTPDIILKASVTETIRQTNKHNELGLRALEAAAEVKTLSTATDAWGQLVDAIAEFKMDNTLNGFAPTGILMSPKFAALIKQDQRFLIGIARDSVVRTGWIGRIDGVDIVESLDLAEGFIIVNSQGFAAPINVNYLLTESGTAANYPGSTILAGELGYGFKVITRVEDENLGTNGYYVSKYTA